MTGDCWYILSAKFGLLDPNRIIEPYNTTLVGMNPVAKKLWANRVFAEFKNLYPSSRAVTILAGRRYREFLVPLLIASCYEVHVPLEGKGIGQQLQWFKRNSGDHT